MKTKSKSKNTAKKPPAAKKTDHASFDVALASFRAVMPSVADRRKELLAQVAGSVAAGLVTSPTPSIASPAGMATAAVDIAEEILRKAGIAPFDYAAKTTSTASTDNADVGAAS